MIKKEEVKHIAGLARIGVDDKDVEKFSKDLSAVLNWIDQLKEADISGVEPTAQTRLHRYAKHRGQVAGISNIIREDKAENFLDKGKIINLFPEKKDNYDKVKSVL